MEITGKLIKILAEIRGESQRGPWVRGGFVIETDSEYPRQVAFTTFGEDRVAMIQNIPIGTTIMVNFNPESREFNERWYTDLRATRVQPYTPGQMPGQATGYGYPQPGAMPAPQANSPFASAPNPQPNASMPNPAPFASTQPDSSTPSMPAENDDLPF